MPDSNSLLHNSIYLSLQNRSTEELLDIWRKNDRQAWTEETFSILHDILQERLGTLPEQNPISRRKKFFGQRKKTKKPLKRLFVILFSALPAMIMILLSIVLPISSDDFWFTNLFLLSYTIFLVVPGGYFGWMSFFRVEEERRIIDLQIAEMKRRGKVFFKIYTLFLPDRFVPQYFLVSRRLIAIIMVSTGLFIFLSLISGFL